MKRSLMCLMLVLVAGSAAVAAPWPDATPSGGDDRSVLELTVYNHGLGLVRETRALQLPDGPSRLEFRDVPAQIRPRTLIIEPSRGGAFRILEQSYEFDLMTQKKILEKYVGRTLSWIQEDGRRIEGTLLGMAEGPVYEVAGEIVFDVPGRLALTSLPNNLRARPTLVWRLEADGAGTRQVDVSYLTGGLSWSADYVLQLDDKGTSADLQAWVSIENRCGTTFDEAGLMLLAGDVNLVGPAPMLGGRKAMMAMESMQADGIVEESVGDFHLYTVPGTTQLKDNEIKQISLFRVEGVPVAKHYRLTSFGSNHYRSGRAGPPQEKISVVHAFRNGEREGLGVPLPAGVIRVYGRSASGARQLLGESRIDHTPRDEKLELATGFAFDLVAERRQVSERKLGDRTQESAWEITLRNHSVDDVMIEVLESAGGEWSIQASSHEAHKLDAGRFRFDIPVVAGRETILTYTVRVSW